jgi:hypothetical protein
MANRTGMITHYMDETEKAKTPCSETDFLAQVPTVFPCKHREDGDGWTGAAEMRRVESLAHHLPVKTHWPSAYRP